MKARGGHDISATASQQEAGKRYRNNDRNENEPLGDEPITATKLGNWKRQEDMRKIG